MLNKFPVVSIILPVYNGEKTLKETIRSIRSQTYDNFELLIGIDGTTDGSKSIAEAFEDNRICIFEHATNLGLAINLNTLISYSNSNSEFIAIAEQDDIYVPERLEWQVEIMRQQPEVGLVSGIAEFVSDQNKVLFPGLLVQGQQFAQGEDLFKFLYIHQLKVVNSCMMIRKSIHIKNGFQFNATYGNFNVDWDYVLRSCCFTKVYGIPKVLALINRKQNNRSVTSKKWDQFRASRSLLKDFRREFPELITEKDYSMALKSHRKIELGHRGYLGIIMFSIYYSIIYGDFYFLKYLVQKIKHFFNGRN